MSTITLTYPRVIRIRRSRTIGWVAVLLITSFGLIGAAILTTANSTPGDSLQADVIPILRNSITPIAVPVRTPPIAEIQAIPSKTPIPASAEADEPSIIPVPSPPSL
jgi:hypothetical protein